MEVATLKSSIILDDNHAKRYFEHVTKTFKCTDTEALEGRAGKNRGQEQETGVRTETQNRTGGQQGVKLLAL